MVTVIGAVNAPAPSAPPWPCSWAKGISFLAIEVGLVGVVALAIDRRWTIVWVPAVLLAGVIYWRASRQYREWAITRYDVHYWRQSLLAVLGLGLILGAAFVLQAASRGNHPSLAAAGVAMVLTGFMPVMHIIRHDVHEVDPTVAPPAPKTVGSYALAWALNALLIVAAVGPILWVLGARWFVPLLISLAWFLSVAVDRVGNQPYYRVIVGLSVVGIVALLWVILRAGVHGRTSTTIAVVVVASFAAMLGLIDAVSAWARNLPRSPLPAQARASRARIGWIVCAVTALAGAVWAFVALGGIRGTIQVLVVVMCIGLGAAFIARGQGFVIVLLLGGLVVWTVEDRTDTAPLDPVPEATKAGTIVALGDSYMSGEGALRYFAGTDVHGHNDCRRSSSAFAYLVAHQLQRHLVFAACSGATAEQLWKTAQIDDPTARGPLGGKPQLENQFPASPDLVLVTIGGNDALFGDIGKGCAFPGSCTDLRAVFDGNLTKVRSAVATALVEVGRKFPSSPVLVVPYPVMLFDKGCDSTPLDRGEVPYLRSFVKNLDATVHAAVDDADAQLAARNVTYFTQGENAYVGEEVCNPHQTERTLNVVTLAPTESDTLVDRMVPTNWTHNSFHPTAAGHQKMAEVLVPYLEHTYPVFGATATSAAVDTSVPVATSAAQCVDRSACQTLIHNWMAEQVVRAIRAFLLPLLLLLAAGWAAMFALHRYYLASP